MGNHIYRQGFSDVHWDRKAAYMLTLQELKGNIQNPGQRIKMPTAKYLRENGRIAAEKQIRKDSWIAAYQEGYALYHACGRSTVFPVHTCGDYLYVSGGVSSYLPEHFFEKQPWYIRLVLEGEDRLDRNQCRKEQEWTVSYNAISEEWGALGDAGKSPLEFLVDREGREEMLQCLTARQKKAVCLCFFQQKTRKEAAAELGVSGAAVSAILSQAFRRLKNQYPSRERAGKAVAAV